MPSGRLCFWGKAKYRLYERNPYLEGIHPARFLGIFKKTYLCHASEGFFRTDGVLAFQ